MHSTRLYNSVMYLVISDGGCDLFHLTVDVVSLGPHLAVDVVQASLDLFGRLSQDVPFNVAKLCVHFGRVFFYLARHKLFDKCLQLILGLLNFPAKML